MLTWLTCFHVLFNSFLPLMAEVSGDKERTFYLDWWNSASMDQFWRKWNLPVHRWCVQHIYLPLVSAGLSKLTGVMVTFLFSAVLHEFLISGKRSVKLLSYSLSSINQTLGSSVSLRYGLRG